MPPALPRCLFSHAVDICLYLHPVAPGFRRRSLWIFFFKHCLLPPARASSTQIVAYNHPAESQEPCDYQISLSSIYACPESGAGVCTGIADCGSCSKVSGCGWCALTQTCVPGDAIGPNSGACFGNYWHYSETNPCVGKAVFFILGCSKVFFFPLRALPRPRAEPSVTRRASCMFFRDVGCRLHSDRRVRAVQRTAGLQVLCDDQHLPGGTHAWCPQRMHASVAALTYGVVLRGALQITSINCQGPTVCTCPTCGYGSYCPDNGGSCVAVRETGGSRGREQRSAGVREFCERLCHPFWEHFHAILSIARPFPSPNFWKYFHSTLSIARPFPSPNPLQPVSVP